LKEVVMVEVVVEVEEVKVEVVEVVVVVVVVVNVKLTHFRGTSFFNGRTHANTKTILPLPCVTLNSQHVSKPCYTNVFGQVLKLSAENLHSFVLEILRCTRK
jgi:hypothetical protein